MKAAVYHGRFDIRMEELERPEPADDELLVAVTGVGICGTDATEFAHGPTMFPIEHRHDVTGHVGPMVPGHEFAGRVVRVGSAVTGFGEGDLITSGAGISCGTCPRCLEGRTNLCDRYSTVGLQRNGGLAEFTTVPATACVNVEHRSLTSDVAAMAQPMSIAVHAMRRGRLLVGERVVVLGAGGIGAFLIHAAAKEGAEVTAVDLDSDRLATAQALGAANLIQTDRESSILEQLTGRGLDPAVVYECTGIPPAVEAAVELTVPGGRLVMVGLHKAPVPVDLLSVSLQEMELIGTLAHVFGADFGHSIDLLEDETDLWTSVAPTVLPLEELVDSGLKPMVDGGPTPIKTLLDPRIDTPRPVQTS
ncbi:MAG: alcohol dehydrogenase catalytic domain-containing protein [Acidimicrobiia bacterium]|nr:alcohol dehydrogenase catalytic domain-containing protein [Acidimicrobiia bacterium]